MKKKLTLMVAAIMAMMSFAANAQSTEPQNKMRQPREFTEFAFEGILLDINQQTRIDSLNAAVQAQAPMRHGNCDKLQCDKQKCDKQKCDKQKCDKQKCDKQKCDKQKCDKQKCDKQKCDKQKCDKPAQTNLQCTPDSAQCKMGKGPKGQNCNGGHHPGMPIAQRPMVASPCPYGPAYIEKVKEILTPDQYTIFLENIVNMAQKPQVGMRHDRPNQKCSMPQNCTPQNRKQKAAK